MDKTPNLTLPELPQLTSGYLVVQKDAWKVLTEYISMQTSTINALITAVESLTALHDLQVKSMNEKIQTLASELAEIAKALEGEYVDE